MGNTRHLDLKVASILSRTNAERIEYIFKDKWIAYPAAKVLLSEMEALLIAPDRQRKKFLLIEGKSNNGKTTLLNHFYKQHLPSRCCGNIISPVIFVEGPAGPSVDEFYANILAELGAPITSTAVNKKIQLKKLLPKVGVKLLLVDNFHDFRYGNADLRMKFIATVRKLCTERKIAISVVATATYIARNVISRDAQMLTRFTFRALPAWKFDNDFLNLLSAFERILPLKKRSSLTNEKLASKILQMSDGILGNIEEILQEAARMAIETGKERIDEEILRGIPFNRKHEPQPIEPIEYPEESMT